MSDHQQQAQFDRLVLPHLDAAYNLARWLAGNDHDAEDIAQDACVRAFRFVNACRGADGRAWLLTIVRNTAYSFLRKNRSHSFVSIDDEGLAEIEDETCAARSFQSADADALRAGLEALPLEYREALVLRELEGLSYKKSPKWLKCRSAPSCHGSPARVSNCKAPLTLRRPYELR